ncbi:MAG: GlsB/YeaQ/YmgE family stress response membrane protein [Chloroflexi bacterium]|nr:GlsB/YeaQ/YmgE family stress response membrane protein [Chloroflexota bacterium]
MNQPVTITFVPEQIITWVIIGLLAGFLAALLVRGRGLGTVGNLLVGLVGALVGGFIFSILNVQVPGSLAGGITLRWIDIITSFIGALIVLVLIGIWRSRR